jgi:hypothetical protein
MRFFVVEGAGVQETLDLEGVEAGSLWQAGGLGTG